MKFYVPTDSERESFYSGMREMYQYIQEANPDLLIWPLRGAYPFYKAYEKLSLEDGQDLINSELLPVGEHYRDSSLKRGMYGKLKQYNKLFFGKVFPQNLDSVMMIDEALTGGSIVRDVNYIFHYFEKQKVQFKIPKFYLAGLEDGLTPKKPYYEDLMEINKFNRILFPHLFTIDDENYLPILSRKGKEFKIEEPPTDALDVLIEGLRF